MHQQIQGCKVKKVWMSKISEPYPWDFCKAAALLAKQKVHQGDLMTQIPVGVPEVTISEGVRGGVDGHVPDECWGSVRRRKGLGLKRIMLPILGIMCFWTTPTTAMRMTSRPGMGAAHHSHTRALQAVLFEDRVPLRWGDVTKITRERYRKAITVFFEWCRLESIGYADYESLDDAFELYINDLFIKYKGKYRQVATETLCALYRRFPRTRGRLGASLASLKSWAKVAPSQAYIPISWGIALLMSFNLLQNGPSFGGGADRFRGIVARAVLTAHHLLLRVGELLRMTRGDLLFGRRHQDGFPRDASLRIPHAKTGHNQHVRVTDRCVVRLLFRLYCKARRGTDRLFPISYGVLRSRFRLALRAIGIDETRVVFHSLRHGGATRLAQQGVDLSLIAIRGRWKNLQNAAHYVQVGQALITTMPLSDKRRLQSEELEARWDEWGAGL